MVVLRRRARIAERWGGAAALCLLLESSWGLADTATEPAGLLAPWNRRNEPDDTARIEGARYERGREPARRLLELAQDPEVRANARTSLSMVRALHVHSRGPLADRVVAQLLTFFAPLATPGRESNADRSFLDASELRYRVRGTAALALAHSGHRFGLRALVVAAGARDESDPLARELARAALTALWPQAVDLPEGARLPAAWVERAYAADDVSRAAFSGPHAWAYAKDAEEGFSLLAVALAEPRDHSRMRDHGAWQASFASQQGAWALRAITLLGLRDAALAEWASTEAKRRVGHQSPVWRSAAAFALAVYEPSATVSFLGDADAARRLATARQAHSGILAEHALRRLRARLEPSHATLVPLPLPLPVALAPSLRATDLETHLLWRGLRLAQASERAAWLAPLAARARRAEATSDGPEPSELRVWLGRENPTERAATAAGLGNSLLTESRALLGAAYAYEPRSDVRRALVIALARRNADEVGVGTSRLLAEIAQLDPDPLCRALARDARSTPSSALVADWTFARVAPETHAADSAAPLRTTTFVTIEGRALEVAADSDGFVAVVGLPFAR